ncbi:unnamed protein product [Rhizoctonia solani]|uniref:Prokaryotic-type class I peptide chain release factors domain-containing protein n=1 Tax=Rhizoctonia solani TaxID=456999 RepID=A0A8H3HK78_9AGAM|nr:unnamed protein product [Rhizoctonia solani]
MSIYPPKLCCFNTSVNKATKYSPKPSPGPQIKPKGVRRKPAQLKLAEPEPVRLVLQTPAQKIAHFQEKLAEIRGNMHDQIATIDMVARTLEVEDRLHPLVHCKHILELNTSSALQELLQAIADKSPQGQNYTTQEDNTAIWLESRILAVQLWIVKRLLLRIQLVEIESRGLHAQAQSLLQEIEAQINGMSLMVATLRDTFHRVRPEHPGRSLQEGWAETLFVKEDAGSGLDDPSTALSSQPTLSQSNDNNTLVSHSILLENLAVVAAHSRRESAIWKIERFLSRIEEVYYRVSRVLGRLDQLAQGLRVAEDRTHPVVSCKHVLQLNTFSSLDMVLRILRKRTPKSRIELEQGMGEALWLDSRLPEVQLEIVKMRLWAFHQTTKSQDLPPQQKNLIRSIRGRIKVAHSLLRNSREEFGSYGPQGKFEIEMHKRQTVVTHRLSNHHLRLSPNEWTIDHRAHYDLSVHHICGIPITEAGGWILSHVSHPKVTPGAALNWRAYANTPTPVQEQIEPDKTDKSLDLFSENSTNDITETHTDKNSPSELEDQSVLLEEIGETRELGEHEAPDRLDRSKYISRGKLMAAHRAREVPELKEEDLEETFVRGSGPGGQAINKTSSSVSLIHLPTGIRVQCQATRSREQNRKIARKIMLEKLDHLANPGLSKLEVQQEKVRAKKRQRAKKAKKRAKLRAEAGPILDDAENSS